MHTLHTRGTLHTLHIRSTFHMVHTFHIIHMLHTGGTLHTLHTRVTLHTVHTRDTLHTLEVHCIRYIHEALCICCIHYMAPRENCCVLLLLHIQKNFEQSLNIILYDKSFYLCCKAGLPLVFIHFVPGSRVFNICELTVDSRL